MAGMQSLSRATAHFAGPEEERQWNQTVIEFSHGWIFLIGAGQGSYPPPRPHPMWTCSRSPSACTASSPVWATTSPHRLG